GGVGADQIDLRSVDSRIPQRRTDGPRRAFAGGLRLYELVRIAGRAATGHNGARLDAALPRMIVPFEYDRRIALAEFHPLTIATERARWCGRNQSQAVETGACVLADWVIAAGDHEIARAIAQQRKAERHA